jgi:hypothetical protein
VHRAGTSARRMNISQGGWKVFNVWKDASGDGDGRRDDEREG